VAVVAANASGIAVVAPTGSWTTTAIKPPPGGMIGSPQATQTPVTGSKHSGGAHFAFGSTDTADDLHQAAVDVTRRRAIAEADDTHCKPSAVCCSLIPGPQVGP